MAVERQWEVVSETESNIAQNQVESCSCNVIHRTLSAFAWAVSLTVKKEPRSRL